MENYSVNARMACVRHEECCQFFIEELAAHDASAKCDLQAARRALMRANAAVAQGMIWAEVIGVDPSGWLDRLRLIESRW